MPSSTYVSLSAQVAMENRMNSIARNVANINTAGYRAEEISFSETMSDVSKAPVSFVSMGETYISRQQGAITKTGNALDLAIEGEAWFSIQRGNEVAYTRDGRLNLDQTGTLTTVNGEPILSANGTPIQMDPEGDSPYVQADGEVVQGEQNVGRIGLFELNEGEKLTRYGGSAVLPEGIAFPLQDLTKARIVQGFVEGSNVNAMTEMTKLIMISRAFESAAKAMETTENAQSEAIRELGSTS
ncbi:flagellar basal-body rod protein FlgF [Cohaesibacter celericrescens]|uniref:Flagellar basal-body rod protein FlgF n=1 Tax=Cohaesibacter celericrescens TaxID=2067669 RepID=A0A2N5XWN1_9HYPH|nr:flagellar basal-body rod protein FlgF [Cohaesibacter celericrescens]PLW75504.1 flagellar basal-body rod protein FlgF [Cohaesibacter celericrescens]PLW78911.1 flagellar basal-body rod protein FlgF [Cohaesibacter celericrescens]